MTDFKNIINYLYDRAASHPAHIAFKYKDNGRWLYYRWSDVLSATEALALRLMELGVEPGDRVGIISETRPEWFISDLSTLAAGAALVPIYPNLLKEDMAYIINNASVKVLILENSEQVQKWNLIKNDCKSVQSILIIELEQNKNVNVESWHQALNQGRTLNKENANKVREIVNSIKAEDIASILYTSGTTGKPKGVVITHEQIVSEITDVFHVMPVNEADVTLTFLPLAHILGRVETWGSVFAGYTLGFCEGIDQIRANLKEIKPTFMIAVPRIFEKLYAAIQAHAETKKTTDKLFSHAKSVAQSVANYRSQNEPVPYGLLLQHKLYEQLVYKNILAEFGGRLRFAISGGAPLPKDITLFFSGVGILLLEGYGLTETTAAITLNTPLRYKFGSVGAPIGDVSLRLNPDGEILVKSKKVMREYYNNPDETKKAFDAGYFCTGDIGEIDSNGFLTITDRKKDLIKTAGGKYVAPQRLEGLLKLSPYISQVLIHGDQRKYVVALITLNEANLLKWAETKKNVKPPFYQDPNVQELIRTAVADANTKLASFESIKRFEILPNDFTVEAGELTPSLKVKRKFCDAKYKSIIDSLYES
jgi:long-chain acyl-CoA synthetase